MKAFFDTSVLVAVFYGDHEHHAASFARLVDQEKSTACTAAHCLAEVYSVVTGMPGKERASPDEALLYIRDVRDRLTTVALDENEYFRLLEDVAVAGVIGGSVYDAIIARCAMRANVQAIYTWNIKHFNRLGEQVASRIRQP